MKASDKVLLSAAAFVMVAITGAVLLAGRVATGTGDSGTGPTVLPDSANVTVLNPEVTSFNAISVQGMWLIRVKGGTATSVRALVPRDLEKLVQVRTSGDTLVCDFGGSDKLERRDLAKAPVLEITMPTLSAVRSYGMVEMWIDRIHCPQLSIEARDGFTLHGTDLTSDSLTCVASGMVKVDIAGGIRSAHVVAEGVGSIALPMRGGSLSGSVNGAVKVQIDGTVGANTLNTTGLASVRVAP